MDKSFIIPANDEIINMIKNAPIIPVGLFPTNSDVVIDTITAQQMHEKELLIIH